MKVIPHRHAGLARLDVGKPEILHTTLSRSANCLIDPDQIFSVFFAVYGDDNIRSFVIFTRSFDLGTYQVKIQKKSRWTPENQIAASVEQDFT